MTSTWREIAEQLTADQIADLELMERRGEPADGLLKEARAYAAINLRGAVDFGHIGWPPEAEVCHEWCEINGRWQRDFTGAVRRVGQCQVFLLGAQFDDGTVQRRRVVAQFDGQGEQELTSAEARVLASALVAVADDAEPAR
jgi:hypothetical protein